MFIANTRRIVYFLMRFPTENFGRSYIFLIQFLKVYGDINLIIWVDTVTRDADCQPRFRLIPTRGAQIIQRSTDIIFGVVQTFHQIIYRRIYIERWSSHID